MVPQVWVAFRASRCPTIAMPMPRTRKANGPPRSRCGRWMDRENQVKVSLKMKEHLSNTTLIIRLISGYRKTLNQQI